MHSLIKINLKNKIVKVEFSPQCYLNMKNDAVLWQHGVLRNIQDFMEMNGNNNDFMKQRLVKFVKFTSEAAVKRTALDMQPSVKTLYFKTNH